MRQPNANNIFGMSNTRRETRSGKEKSHRPQGNLNWPNYMEIHAGKEKVLPCQKSDKDKQKH